MANQSASNNRKSHFYRLIKNTTQLTVWIDSTLYQQ
jgi:hypothetical protein